MDMAANVTRRLKDWGRSRPRLDIEESATWFLLIFVFALGLSNEDLGFHWLGPIPQITAPQVSLAMVILCITVSIVVIFEPVLPYKMREWTRAQRHSALGQSVRYIGICFAFILGLPSGLGLLIEKAPSLALLISTVYYLGVVIVILMVIKLFLLWWLYLRPPVQSRAGASPFPAKVDSDEGPMTRLEDALNRPFPQQHLLSKTGFASFLRERGFDVGTDGISAFVDAGLIEELGDQFGAFHPFQIWPIFSLLRGFDTRLEVGISHHGLSPERLKNFIETNWSHRAEHPVNFPRSEEIAIFNHRILPFLLWAESHFLPVIRGSRAGMVSLVNADVVQWEEWRASINLEEWLSSHSLSIEDLSEWRDRLLFRAYQYDPNPDLYLLLRSMPFEKRNRFRGRLRLAYDLYEIAEMTRLLIEQVSDRPVRKEWDPTGHPGTSWVGRLYGTQPRFGAPEFLRPLIRSYGLDPAPRVRWLVEGQTERAFVFRYAERLGRNIDEYATVDHVHGDGTLTGDRQQPAVDAYLRAARDEQCFSALTFDHSDDASRRIQELIAEGLVSLCFVLNRPDFERDNFEVKDLVTVAISLASHTPYPIKLSRECLVNEVEQRIREKNEDFKKALDTVLHFHGEAYRLRKGAEWGKGLAEVLSDKRDAEFQAGTYSEESLAKIEKQILMVLRGSEPGIDFPLSMENLHRRSLEVL